MQGNSEQEIRNRHASFQQENKRVLLILTISQELMNLKRVSSINVENVV